MCIADKIESLFEAFLQRMLSYNSFTEQDLKNMIDSTKHDMLEAIAEMAQARAVQANICLQPVQWLIQDHQLCVLPDKKIRNNL